EAAMEQMLLHPDLRRQWLGNYARSLRRKHFEPAAPRPPRLLALLHHSPATRALARKLVGRLQGLGETVCVLSDDDSWRTTPDVRFRSLSDGGRPLEMADIRRQVAEWDQANRIVVDAAAAPGLDWAALLRPADCALVFVRAGEVRP